MNEKSLSQKKEVVNDFLFYMLFTAQ